MKRLVHAVVVMTLSAAPAAAQQRWLSHPPLRTAPPPGDRPMPKGAVYYVDPQRGDDAHPGTDAAPWRSLRHAVGQLKPGATLLLRGGVYYEQTPIRVTGRPEAPITIAAHPGEQAILDGGLPDFFDRPGEMWEPAPDGAAGEFRSRQRYPNLRTVYGWFGDSMVGLHTYYHDQDLRADNELWDLDATKKDIKPLYCGPGLWYDAETGYIHCRLTHTRLPQGTNYRGVTDPRRLPLVMAPYRATPLQLDGAKHVRLQDLIVRGGGYETITLDQCTDIAFDNVTIWAGSYGMRITGTQQLKIHQCGFYGSLPPWSFRTDTSLRTYPDRGERDISRLGTHALLVPEAGREFSVYAFPINDDWEISHCDFTDAHDGVYLGAVNVRFHHNRVHAMQDDGIYLSPMYPRYGKRNAELHVYQNIISNCLTALAFGGPETKNNDLVFIYRNIMDLRQPVQTGRPSTANPKGGSSSGKVMGDHGSPPWSRMKTYHNTCVMASASRSADMGLLDAASIDRPRLVVNNLYLHLASLPTLTAPLSQAALYDGNLYWSPHVSDKQRETWFTKFRAKNPLGEAERLGLHRTSILADPLFKYPLQDGGSLDVSLKPSSPAVNAGVPLPADCPDPLQNQDAARPDIGAVPLGATWTAGRGR